MRNAPEHFDPAPPTRASLRFYALARGLVALFSKLYWRVEVHGRDNIPATGPFILAPVHRSNIDSPLMGNVTRRRLRFMGKDAMWKYRWSGWLFTALGAFPVRRGTADREAMRRCLQVLEQGEAVVMFPEGTRQGGPVVENVFDGPAYVACRTHAPLVPVGIGGSEGAMPRGAKFIRPVKLVVIVGESIAPPPPAADGARVPRRVVRELTDELRVAVQKLFDEAQQRQRAG